MGSEVVIHDRDKKKFFIISGDQECYLLYRVNSDGSLDYYSTYTPKELRGKGLAASVVKFALEYASKNNKKVVPSCSYVKDYIAKNPEYSFSII